MKKTILTSILVLLVSAGITVRAQERPAEYLGLPGDNLNLYAVMNLFQESETLEGFEKNLNEENSRINNLDLNGDNFVDYLMVTDYVDGQDHNIVLSVALNSDERQDVAVFTVQKLRNGEVEIQLIGDEELYGKNYIIEPIYDDNNSGTPNPGYNGRNSGSKNVTVIRTNYYEVAAWPMVRFIYRPDYVIWRSTWHWGYYPSYWQPWSPFYYDYYYGYYSNWYPVYYQHYRHWNQPRYTRYNTFYYTTVRAYSPTVSVRIKEGNYKSTYSRPETRRDGEALYNKTRESEVSKSSGSSTGTAVSRRSATTTTVRQGTNSNNSGQSTAAPRRSATTSSDKAAAKPATTTKSTNVSTTGTRRAAAKAAAPARTTVKPSRTESSTSSTKEKEKNTSTPAKRR